LSRFNILLTIAMVISFLLGAIVAPSMGMRSVGGVFLFASGAISILFRKRIVSVINEERKTNYSPRLPTLWGIGVMIIGMAFLLDWP